MTWTSRLTVERFRAADIEEAIRAGMIDRVERDVMVGAGLAPYRTIEVEHNLEVYTGLNNMLRLLIGTSASTGTNYANGNARLCVGDGGGTVPTAAVTDTDLAASTGSTHRQMNACDATYPSVPNGGNNSASAILTAVSTFASGVANFAWNEWGMDGGGATGTGAATALFNHKGVALGTKTSAAAWVLSATITQA